MTVRSMMLASSRSKPTPKRVQYPVDNVMTDDILFWRVNADQSVPVFLGFGEHDGHKTVKFRFNHASTISKCAVKFPVEQRIKQIVFKRDKAGWTAAAGLKSMAAITNHNVDNNGNANALGMATANVWRTGSLAVIQPGEFFTASINDAPSYPVVFEFYVVDDMTPY